MRANSKLFDLAVGGRTVSNAVFCLVPQPQDSLTHHKPQKYVPDMLPGGSIGLSGSSSSSEVAIVLMALW